MSKLLYSLMLDDQVVAAVDLEAHRRGVNRSALVNQILAQQLSVATPEMQIRAILSEMEDHLQHLDLLPVLLPNRRTLSMKSALAYKYRPTVRYDVELYRNHPDCIGVLSVTFRTQSRALADAIFAFCRLWQQIERSAGVFAEYAWEQGRFLRTIPKGSIGKQNAGQALAQYVHLFDTQLKSFLAGESAEREIETAYRFAMQEG